MRRWLGIPVPVAQATPPVAVAATPAEMETRLLAIELAVNTAYEERKTYAAMVAEANRQIAELQGNYRNQSRELAEQRLMNSSLIKQIGNLQGRLEVSEHSREAQGERIGNLEMQAAEVPGLRHQVVVFDMRSKIYQTWGYENMKRLQAAGLEYDPEPHIPTLKLPHPEDLNYGA